MKNQIRITVVGDGDTGKTCMLIVYKDRKFDERYIPTVYVCHFCLETLFSSFYVCRFDVYSMTVPINKREYTVILQDTAGQEEFDKLRQLAYKEVKLPHIIYRTNRITYYKCVLDGRFYTVLRSK